MTRSSLYVALFLSGSTHEKVHRADGSLHLLYVYLRRDWKLRAASVEPFVLGCMTYRTTNLAIDLFERSE